MSDGPVPKSIQRLIDTLTALDGQSTITPKLSKDSKDKIAGLARTGRNFFQPTKGVQQSCVRFLKAEMMKKNATVQSMRQAIADGAKAHIMLRFAYGGNDIVLKPLTAKYLAHKAAKGLDSRIGVATKTLLNELNQTKWSIKR